jgi:hypothetical protein
MRRYFNGSHLPLDIKARKRHSFDGDQRLRGHDREARARGALMVAIASRPDRRGPLKLAQEKSGVTRSDRNDLGNFHNLKSYDQEFTRTSLSQ